MEIKLIQDKKVLISAFLVASLVSSNFLAAKLVAFTIPIFGLVSIPAGFVGIALAFLWSDLLSELYGPNEARNVVNSTIIALILVVGLTYIAVLMPAAPFYESASSFQTIMLSSAPITISSILTLLVSQNVDIMIFDQLRTWSDKKWIRNVGSTTISQFIDTSMFIFLGFFALPILLGTSVTPLAAIPGLIFSQYVVKVGVALLDTPLFYAISSTLS